MSTACAIISIIAFMMLLFVLVGVRRELVSDQKEGFVEYIVYGPGWGWRRPWGWRHPWGWRRRWYVEPPPGAWYTFW